MMCACGHIRANIASLRNEVSSIIFAKQMHHIAIGDASFKNTYALVYLPKCDIINSPLNKNLQVCAMGLKLRELTLKNEILQTYEIYKHCMFMPTEEKFNNN